MNEEVVVGEGEALFVVCGIVGMLLVGNFDTVVACESGVSCGELVRALIIYLYQ